MELGSRRVGLFQSGGLPAMTVGAWLAEQDVEVEHFVADIGQTGPMTAAQTAEWLTGEGHKAHLIDLRGEMADMALDLAACQATYGAGYWNTTSASRYVLVSGMAQMLRSAGCGVLAHGCVGGGNDQARFSRYAAALAPDVEVLIPWTQPFLLERFPDRASMGAYLAERNYPAEVTSAAGYSIDANLAGASHESNELESLATPPTAATPLMTVWPVDGADTPELMSVRFAAGRPVQIQGQPVSSLEALTLANAAGRRHGISLRSVVENRVNGTKCRCVYESPGMDVLGTCVSALMQVCLDKPATALMREISDAVSTAVYEGRVLETTHVGAASAAKQITAALNGLVEIELYKGNVTVRSFADLEERPEAARQTRFRHGGHHWEIG
ncbi:argininosuccinate synthase [Micromonospora ureilytica]|nr:argininosuccinate synthase [Micromonospora ureilytica]